jgi:primosomal replication protein N
VNNVQMQAILIERTALRYTPAGIPVVEAQLQHRSELVEAGLQRRLQFDFSAIAIGDTARQLAVAELGSKLGLSGFLAPRSRRSTRLLVHVLEFSRLAEPAAVVEPDQPQGKPQ